MACKNGREAAEDSPERRAPGAQNAVTIVPAVTYDKITAGKPTDSSRGARMTTMAGQCIMGGNQIA